MLTKAEAEEFAADWIAAWNSHELDRIMAHYHDDVELISPVAMQLLQAPGGLVSGKANLRAYFQRGLQAFPELRFELERVVWSVRSVVLYYANQRGSHTGEFMELAPDGKVVRVVAHYSA